MDARREPCIHAEAQNMTPTNLHAENVGTLNKAFNVRVETDINGGRRRRRSVQRRANALLGRNNFFDGTTSHARHGSKDLQHRRNDMDRTAHERDTHTHTQTRSQCIFPSIPRCRSPQHLHTMNGKQTKTRGLLLQCFENQQQQQQQHRTKKGKPSDRTFTRVPRVAHTP